MYTMRFHPGFMTVGARPPAELLDFHCAGAIANLKAGQAHSIYPIRFCYTAIQRPCGDSTRAGVITWSISALTLFRRK